MKDIGNQISKSSQSSNVPTNIIKKNSDITVSFICEKINNMTDSSMAPLELNLAHITLVFQTGSKNSKDLLASCLISQTFMEDACINRCQITLETFHPYFSVIFDKDLAQHCLLVMIEKWVKSMDKGKTFRSLLTVPSKASNYLPHHLIIVKSNAFGFNLSSSKLINNYASCGKQKTKINSSYSLREDITWCASRLYLGPTINQNFCL